MATTEAAPDDQKVTEKHEKDVVITAYSDGEYEDEREFIDAIFGDVTDIDLFETEERETHNVELRITIEGEGSRGPRTVNSTVSPYMSSEKEALLDGLKEEELPEWVELIDETIVDDEFTQTPSYPLGEFIKSSVEKDILLDLGYEHGAYAWDRAWTREVEDTSVDSDNGDTISHDVRFVTNTAGIRKKQVLVHQGDRTKENQYEGDDELWSFEIKAHVEAETDEDLDAVSDRLVPPVYQTLYALDGITDVRLTSCEQNVTRVGECYNF